jgi:hypothetical protein
MFYFSVLFLNEQWLIYKNQKKKKTFWQSFTIKPSEGIQATSFAAGDKLFISPEKLLPLERFTNPG